MERFKGKMLVRKCKANDGKEYLILCGIFTPSQPMESFSDKDEMWAVELGVLDVLKFEGIATSGPSPEEFLNGKMQAAGYWNRKSN